MQPLVGSACDESTSSWGRRRPTLAVSTILTAASMLAISFTRQIWVAALFFQLLNIAANGLEAAARGLVMDVSHAGDQQVAWAAYGIASSLGSLAVGLIGGVDFVKLIHSEWTQLQIVTALTVGTLLLTTMVTLLAIREVPFRPKEAPAKEDDESQGADRGDMRVGGPDQSGESRPLLVGPNRNHRQSKSCFSQSYLTFVKAFQSLLADVPPLVSRINKASFWGWGAASSASIFFSAWMQLLSSDPVYGLRMASFASAASTIFSVVSNFVLPAIAHSFKVRLKWFLVLGNLVGFGLLVIGPIFARDLIAAASIITAMGLFWCCLVWVPFALLGEFVSGGREEVVVNSDSADGDPAIGNGDQRTASEPKNYGAGEAIGIINFYQSVPQLLTIALSSIVLGGTKEHDAARSLGMALQLGGCFALVSAYHSARIPENIAGDESM